MALSMKSHFLLHENLDYAFAQALEMLLLGAVGVELDSVEVWDQLEAIVLAGSSKKKCDKDTGLTGAIYYLACLGLLGRLDDYIAGASSLSEQQLDSILAVARTLPDSVTRLKLALTEMCKLAQFRKEGNDPEDYLNLAGCYSAVNSVLDELSGLSMVLGQRGSMFLDDPRSEVIKILSQSSETPNIRIAPDKKFVLIAPSVSNSAHRIAARALVYTLLSSHELPNLYLDRITISDITFAIDQLNSMLENPSSEKNPVAECEFDLVFAGLCLEVIFGFQRSEIGSFISDKLELLESRNWPQKLICLRTKLMVKISDCDAAVFRKLVVTLLDELCAIRQFK